MKSPSKPSSIKPDTTKPKINPIWYFVGAASAVIFVWCFFWWWLQTDPERGTFGDLFGSVNALFSGLAFAGLIYTIRLQSEELSLQRKELHDTREVLSGQAETLALQQFENTFFQLASRQAEIVDSLSRLDRGQRIEGRELIERFVGEADNRRTTKNSGLDHLSPLERTVEAYEYLYLHEERHLGHYFRHLYHLVKFVDSSDIADKRRYTSFVRAQISSNEVVLLFYNCLYREGSRFKPLVEKYGLLKHMPNVRSRFDVESATSYRPSAFLSDVPKADDLARIGAKSATEWRSSH